jgi:hypothetical protein
MMYGIPGYGKKRGKVKEILGIILACFFALLIGVVIALPTIDCLDRGYPMFVCMGGARSTVIIQSK